MRNFGKVSTAIFTDPKSRRWDDETFRLVVYLLAGPHANLLGCFRMPRGYVEADLGKGYHTVSRLFQKLTETNFLSYCAVTERVWIKKFLHHTQFENGNVAKSAFRVLKEIPTEASFFAEFGSAIKQLG